MKSNNTIIKGLLYLTLSFLGFYLVFFLLYPQATRCTLIYVSNFDRIQSSVYVSPGTSAEERDSLNILLAKSDERINEFWNGKESNPTIIYCHDEELYKKYGSETDSPANIFGTPIGSYIVIGPLGLNLDVVSHEASHAELSKRLGWLTMEWKIPTWFNEGLALMVDYRFTNPDTQFRHEDYRKEWYRKTGFGANKVELREISSVNGFFNGESEDIYLAYLTSGMEVSRWLQRVGQKGLMQFINQVNDGDGFGKAYLTVQRENTRQRYYKEPYYLTKNKINN